MDERDLHVPVTLGAAIRRVRYRSSTTPIRLNRGVMR
jgi:hypothetical protein